MALYRSIHYGVLEGGDQIIRFDNVAEKQSPSQCDGHITRVFEGGGVGDRKRKEQRKSFLSRSSRYQFQREGF